MADRHTDPGSAPDPDLARAGETAPPICHRCGAMLTSGEGSFYVVNIEAFADPTPPRLDADPDRDLAAEIEALVSELREVPEAELRDQVHRRLTILLCWPCYRIWIERPA